MRNAKQCVFVLIAVVMIVLSVGLIFLKKSDEKENNTSKKDGSERFFGPVENLVFEAGACNIDVVTGEEDTYVLRYEGLKYGDLSSRLEDGELKITYKQEKNRTAKMLFSDDVDDQQITLMIPKDAVLTSAFLEFGAADIEIEQLVAEKLYVTVGTGELKADNLTATEFAKLKVGAGAFYAEKVKLTNAELECGVGEMGLSGNITGESTVDCGVGSMELELDGKQEEYYGELSCGLGEIRCGSIQIEGSGNRSYGTSSAERRMDIKCGIGEVDVRFH